MSSLKKKIEWMLAGNFLKNNDDDRYAYGINLRTYKFYSTYLWNIRHKHKRIINSDVVLPMEDIAKNMIIYDDTK